MTPYKGASVCNSNLDKEAILLAKGSRINPFLLPQHAPTPLIRQRMLNAHNRKKAVGSTKPTSATPGVNKESRKPTLCWAYWGKQNLEAIDRSCIQHHFNSQEWDNLPTAQSSEMKKQPMSKQPGGKKGGPGYRKEDQESQGRTGPFLL